MDIDMEVRHVGHRALDRSRRAATARGVIGIAFSVALLVWPTIGLATLTAVFGLWALLSGITRLVEFFRASGARRRRGWLAVDGIFGVAIGVAVMIWPGLSALGLLYAIAVWALVGGAVSLALSVASPWRDGTPLLMLLTGLVSIAFGVTMFARPDAGAVALVGLIAAFALVSSIMQLAYAWRLHRVSGDLDSAWRAASEVRA
jgi:uncharacterized membrane protein HdeD (DUF308 family)